MTNKKLNDKEVSLTISTEEGLEYIRLLTGESNIPTGQQYITFNGKDGKFYYNKAEIGESITGTIVKSLVKAETAYSPAGKYKNGNVHTQELPVLRKGDVVDLYDSGGSLVASVEYEEAKEKYDLKFKQVLYISLDEMGGELVKLSLGGRSLKALWAYLGSFRNDTVIRYKTLMKSEEFESESGEKFFRIAFQRGDELSKEEVQAKLDILSSLKIMSMKSAESFIEEGDDITIIE